MRRQAREFLQSPDHRIKRVGDADHEGLGGVLGDAFAHGFHDLEVDAQKVIAAHAGFARHACGDDADIGACDVGIVVRALEFGIEPLGRAAFGDVECFALRRALGDVEQDDIPQFLERDEVGECATDLTGADQRDLGSGHEIDLQVPH